MTVCFALLVAGRLTEVATLREKRSYLLGLENSRTVARALCLQHQLEGVGSGHDVRNPTSSIFVILLENGSQSCQGIRTTRSIALRLLHTQ